MDAAASHPDRHAQAAGAAGFNKACEATTWSVKTADDRRKRRRRPTRLPGWCYLNEHVVEVQMRNVSPDGAGFVSPENFAKGQSIHLKIGIGSTRRPRAAQVMFCRRRADGRFDVGVRFIALVKKAAG